MAGLMLCGAIPTALACLVNDVNGFYAVRFFIGILGGTFVPCQVWTTAFFDESIVGTANALAGGWGNAGGGIGFFAMPAIIESLQSYNGYSAHNAWRVVVAFIILLFGDDCPEGNWKDRSRASTKKSLPLENQSEATLDTTAFSHTDTPTKSPPTKMTITNNLQIAFSPQTLLLSLCYMCSFGGEVALESYLVPWYTQVSQTYTLGWTTQQIGNISSIFGLLNIVTRPLGGILSDYYYKRTRSLGVKKRLLMVLWGVQGVAFVVLGVVIVLPSARDHIAGVFLLITVIAVSTEMANGATYALVPHVYPSQNGFVSEVVGAWGNIGAILFSVVYRYNSFSTSFWINGGVVGVCCLLGSFVAMEEKKSVCDNLDTEDAFSK